LQISTATETLTNESNNISKILNESNAINRKNNDEILSPKADLVLS